MQAATGSVSWVAAQPSVLGRCGGGAPARGTASGGGGGGRVGGVVRCWARAQEKRPPRVRKTKEERRELVVSFINNYRVSNDGKFPSVNLTHKEVGGSYYIVREIVRDIIQENKVLGPGGLNSTALSFEDYTDSSELSAKHELGQDTIEILQTTDDSPALHDSASEMPKKEEFSLQNNVISTQTLLGSSNILEAGVLNSVVQNGSARAGMACLEAKNEKLDKDPSSGSVDVDLNRSGEQGSLFAHVSVSDNKIELESLWETDRGAVSGVTDGVSLSPEPDAAYETNGALLSDRETLPNDSHDGTTDGAVSERNLQEKTNALLHTMQTNLQEQSLNGIISSDDVRIMDDQSSSVMDDFTSIIDSQKTEVTSKTIDLSNEQKLQDEQEKADGLISQPVLDTKGLLPLEGNQGLVEEDDFKKSKSMITTEDVEASNLKHDEGMSTTTTISRRASKAQQKKEDNLFWLVLRAFVIAVSKLWSK